MIRIDFPPAQAGAPRLQASFDAPLEVLVAWRQEEVPGLLARVEACARAGLWCVGGVAYDAAAAFDPAFATHAPAPGWPLARFDVFDAAAPLPQEEGQAASWSAWLPGISAPAYAARAAEAQAAMAAGECYQVNLTTALTARFAGAPAHCFQRLRQLQPGGYLLGLDWGDRQVLSASPELFFEWDPVAGRVVCRPMKGTAPRGPDAESDAAARAGLVQSPKERAENVMIVDLLRHDLARLARPGGVRVPSLFDTQALPTVWQMTSTVEADLRPGVGLADIFRALFPCGSVTGAPKVRAMHWIRALEDGPRGLYCGALGIVRPGGAATFNVPIRTLALEREGAGWSARYGVGSGLTVYADAAAEWRELEAKSRLAEQLAGGFQLLETLRLEDGEFWLLAQHRQRLRASAAYFAFPFDEAAIDRELQQVAARHPGGPWRVRLLLRNDGRLQAEALPLQETVQPVAVALAAAPLATAGRDADFIRHKTDRREHYDALARPGVFDTLLFNERGELTEFTRGNLALKLGGKWQTPPLASGLLPGTFRSFLLESGQLHEAVLTPADLRRAQGCAFYNGLRGWLAAEVRDPPPARA